VRALRSSKLEEVQCGCLTNTGKRAGNELVQLYARDLVGSLTRPVRELKGFERVILNPGETPAVSQNFGVTGGRAGRLAYSCMNSRVWFR